MSAKTWLQIEEHRPANKQQQQQKNTSAESMAALAQSSEYSKNYFNFVKLNDSQIIVIPNLES